MTFQRSVFLSFLIHILIFGSAIAVAGYARGTLWSHRDAIMVSLVGSGGAGLSARTAQRAEHHKERSDARPIMTSKTAAPAPQPEIPAKPSVREEASIPVKQESQATGAGDTSGSGHQQAEAGTGATGFGLISAEQWAVIESSIERSKSYPRTARERGIQGVVHVRFKLRPTGEVETVEIVKSSGYDVLDTASIRTVYRAAPMPYVNGWVEVPMAYVLK